MRHQFPLGLVAALAGALAGCGDSSGPGANQSFRATDPSGDTFGSATVQPDLTAFTIVHDTGGIDVMLDFTANVQSPVTGGTNVVVGFIDLDTDQDSTTGTGSAVDVFRPDGGSTGMGVEYYVDLFGYNADSTVFVYDALAGTPTGSVRPRFQGRRITVRVPRALLGNDDGFLNAATVVGSESEPTDIAPENGHVRVGGASPAPRAGVGAARVGGQAHRGWR